MTKRPSDQPNTDTVMKQSKQETLQVTTEESKGEPTDKSMPSLPIPMVLLHQGAEARVYLTEMFTSSGPRKCVIKERFVKQYRHPTLDNNLSGQRLRAEARLLLHCRKLGIDVPPVLLVDIPTRRLWLGHIGPEAVTLCDWFKSLAATCPCGVCTDAGGDFSPVQVAGARLMQLTRALGRLLARLHANHVTHGDLTMANILVRKATPEQAQGQAEPRLVLIDFGLASAISHSATQRLPEEKAVDLYVFERALINALNLDFLHRIGHSFPQFATPEALMASVLDAYCAYYSSEATPLRCEGGKGTIKINDAKKPEDSVAVLQAELKANVSKLDEVRLRGRKRLMIG